MTYNDFAQLTMDTVSSMTREEKRAVIAHRAEIMHIESAALSLEIHYPMRKEAFDRIEESFINDLRIIGLAA